jgi:hypothetical protein
VTSPQDAQTISNRDIMFSLDLDLASCATSTALQGPFASSKLAEYSQSPGIISPFLQDAKNIAIGARSQYSSAAVHRPLSRMSSVTAGRC